MNSVYHEGEQFIQESMGVREKSDSLSSMIRDDLPVVAARFLENLNFSVISFSYENKDIFSSVVYGFEAYIVVLDKSEILIDLKKRSSIPKEFFEAEIINIGFIGLDFENKMRIRINGKGKIKEDKLHLKIQEAYSNCPSHITDRSLLEEISFKGASKLFSYTRFDTDTKRIIENTDTFFIASSHKEKSSDISHRGGKKGFLKIISDTQLEYEEVRGNNMYNTLGNIHTNPNISIIIIDFMTYEILHIKGIARISEYFIKEKKRLKVSIECTKIDMESNSFCLRYDK